MLILSSQYKTESTSNTDTLSSTSTSSSSQYTTQSLTHFDSDSQNDDMHSVEQNEINPNKVLDESKSLVPNNILSFIIQQFIV